MAGYMELDSFVKKFVSLWENGCDANLQVETTAGKAVVSLKVTLGPAENLNFSDHGGCRGGSPSRQRRRERRAAARIYQSKAEEAFTEKVSERQTDTEEVEVKVDTSEDKVEYELKIDAHIECKNYNVIEGVEVNFDGALDNLKVEKDDPSRDIVVQKVQENKATEMLELERKLLIYRVSINDNRTSKAVIESWKESHMFDDLAFRGAVRDKINLRIRDVQKI